MEMTTILISEVWNASAKSVELARIPAIMTDSGAVHPYRTKLAVQAWIQQNRPDLMLALGLSDHGYHAKAL